MIKQNIKVAIIFVLGLLTIWLVVFAFIKLDVATQAIINFDEREIIVDAKNAAYIQNRDKKDNLKIEYEKQYWDCTLYDPTIEDEYWHFPIYIRYLPEWPTGLVNTHLIIDSLNIYQYLFKK